MAAAIADENAPQGLEQQSRCRPDLHAHHFGQTLFRPCECALTSLHRRNVAESRKPTDAFTTVEYRGGHSRHYRLRTAPHTRKAPSEEVVRGEKPKTSRSQTSKAPPASIGPSGLFANFSPVHYRRAFLRRT
ncbi:hypothetical protein Cob_v012394 [Colletotrichum orbiculare MAFF 240422]|uniref:Uncharacterized protein n=1 Tax=Colletotrichum orbiculare (strain 104-T / ATCC 96160 / CBS 514.97 / LARS 414 / MAFF 240422) TaxID=1213857 RepID=A0A484F9W9_COLOR|nr:hypothetical protein Cob_v012394 [Colletotrichum orbiculare MAFF 240422]